MVSSPGRTVAYFVSFSRKFDATGANPACKPGDTCGCAPLWQRSCKAAHVELKIAADRLIVSEIFDSIQGEGPTMGLPCTFLRLGHCNLRCSWCDTRYAWDWQRFDMSSELRQWTLDDVRLRLSDATRLLVTGGEPMLQAEALGRLLPQLDAVIEIETAGTVHPGALAHLAQWNVSPKLTSSGNARAKRLRLDVLQAFARLGATFKLVVDSDDDVDEACALTDELGVARAEVWLMPQARDLEALRTRATWLATACERTGTRLGWRLHVAIWGDRRGI